MDIKAFEECLKAARKFRSAVEATSPRRTTFSLYEEEGRLFVVEATSPRRTTFSLYEEEGRLFVEGAELDMDHPEKWGALILAAAAERRLMHAGESNGG